VNLQAELISYWLQAAKGVLEERFKTGKNRWFFSKLRFWELYTLYGSECRKIPFLYLGYTVINQCGIYHPHFNRLVLICWFSFSTVSRTAFAILIDEWTPGSDNVLLEVCVFSEGWTWVFIFRWDGSEFLEERGLTKSTVEVWTMMFASFGWWR